MLQLDSDHLVNELKHFKDNWTNKHSFTCSLNQACERSDAKSKANTERRKVLSLLNLVQRKVREI